MIWKLCYDSFCFTVSSAGPGEIANGKSGRQLMPGLLLLRDSNYTSGTQNMYQGIYKFVQCYPIGGYFHDFH